MHIYGGKLAVLLFLLPVLHAAAAPLRTFSTGGHTVYHLRPATVERSGQRVIVSATYDGAVLCHTREGRLLWEAQTGGAFPFDLCVADLDSDGLDETLVASADGGLHVFGPDGHRIWVFQRVAPLFQVCVAELKDHRRIVLTGGVEQRVFALSSKGAVLGELPTADCIRLMRTGDVLGEGRDVLAVTTASSGLQGKLGLLLVDPSNLRVIWRKENMDLPFVRPPDAGHRYYSMALVDVNQDGKRDILLSSTGCENGKLSAYDQKGDLIYKKSDLKVPNIPYRMNLLEPVKLKNDEFILGHFGNVLILYELDGTCRDVVTGAISGANRAFDPVTQTLYLGSDVSGGDEIVALQLDEPGWQEAFVQMQPVGRLAEVVRNLEVLRAQVSAFERPIYQVRGNQADILLLDEYNEVPIDRLRPPPGTFPGCRFVSHVVLGQRPESGEFWCQTRSPFAAYDKTTDEIVAIARNWEQSGREFVIQAAHGHNPHMSLATFERVLQAAPKCLWGFEFSEAGQEVGPRDQAFAEKILLPLAELCRRYGGKKILFRNKNIFWNGNCYVPYWKGILLSGKYRDVLVPGLEETNSRTQDLSLAGRIGLWLTGSFDHWASRAETDNACFDRMWEWGGQQVLSHSLRQLVANAAYGADVFFNSIHQGPFSESLGRQYGLFYEMLAKGVVVIPRRGDLVSVSSVCVGMRTPAPGFLASGNNGHRYTFPSDDHGSLVFDRMDAYWAGSLLSPHDFSRLAFGVTRRQTNFLPLEPYGMIPIVPAEAQTGDQVLCARKILTDGKFYYDESGTQRSPAEFRTTVEAMLREGAAALPIVVRGTAHWVAANIDSTHIRVTLVDPGYLVPADQDVEIILQQSGWKECTDILSGEKLSCDGRKVRVHIPMGSLRIVDFARE